MKLADYSGSSLRSMISVARRNVRESGNEYLPRLRELEKEAKRRGLVEASNGATVPATTVLDRTDDASELLDHLYLNYGGMLAKDEKLGTLCHDAANGLTGLRNIARRL